MLNIARATARVARAVAIVFGALPVLFWVAAIDILADRRWSAPADR